MLGNSVLKQDHVNIMVKCLFVGQAYPVRPQHAFARVPSIFHPLTRFLWFFENRLVAQLYFHHRMNLPSSVAQKMASPIRFLIFKRMTDIEERLASNGDDGSLIERQLLCRLV
jgi:hypothetical protein